MEPFWDRRRISFGEEGGVLLPMAVADRLLAHISGVELSNQQVGQGQVGHCPHAMN